MQNDRRPANCESSPSDGGDSRSCQWANCGITLRHRPKINDVAYYLCHDLSLSPSLLPSRLTAPPPQFVNCPLATPTHLYSSPNDAIRRRLSFTHIYWPPNRLMCDRSASYANQSANRLLEASGLRPKSSSHFLYVSVETMSKSLVKVKGL